MKYETVIGLEIHAELATKSKLFCGCANDPFGAEHPNVHICPICLGLPGTLPVMNRAAVESTVRVGLALGCQIGWPEKADSLQVTGNRLEDQKSPATSHLPAATYSKWDRKNYFYPDLPKAYQISQYDLPICHGGALEFGLDGHTVAVTRIHLEEDTGKLIHPAGADYSLIDYNRAGVPLLELVTEPEIRSGAEAAEFARHYQLILRTLGVAEADMEKGGMRVEVNISLRQVAGDSGQVTGFGSKVEIKNLNSFKIVERAIKYEIERQTILLEQGQPVIQETRGWDEAKQVTFSQRVKETAADYRYFPEPDLPPVTFHESNGKSQATNHKIQTSSKFQTQITKLFRPIDINGLRKQIPELPIEVWQRWVREWAIPDHVAWRLTADPPRMKYVDEILAILAATPDLPDARRQISGRKVADWVLNGIADPSVAARELAKLAIHVSEGTLTQQTAKTMLEEARSTGQDLTAIIESQPASATEVELETIIDGVLAKSPQAIQDYRSGKSAAFGYLMGQVMQKTRGRIEPAQIKIALEKKLDE